MKTIKRKSKSKSTLVIIIIVGIALLASTAALAYSQKWWPFDWPERFIVDGINYGPPTQQEIESGDDAKKKLLDDAKNNNQDDTDSESRKVVNVGVSFADKIESNLEVRAFVSGVVEGTGTCTATLTKSGSQPVSKSSKAFINVSTSQCQPILIPLGDFDKAGEWVLVVTYASPTSAGESEKITITI